MTPRAAAEARRTRIVKTVSTSTQPMTARQVHATVTPRQTLRQTQRDLAELMRRGLLRRTDTHRHDGRDVHYYLTAKGLQVAKRTPTNATTARRRRPRTRGGL